MFSSISDDTIDLLETVVKTELNKVKLPEYQFALERVNRLSFDFDERHKIINFLHMQLLSEDWRRIVNSLNILTALFTSGSHSLVSEFATGGHFDLLQRLLLLSAFVHADLRIKQLVSTKAKELRELAKNKIEQNISPNTSPTPPATVPRRLLRNVYVGHRSDTEDEE
jgi:hypothetical protein